MSYYLWFLSQCSPCILNSLYKSYNTTFHLSLQHHLHSQCSPTELSGPLRLGGESHARTSQTLRCSVYSKRTSGNVGKLCLLYGQARKMLFVLGCPWVLLKTVFSSPTGHKTKTPHASSRISQRNHLSTPMSHT